MKEDQDFLVKVDKIKDCLQQVSILSEFMF